MKRPRIDRAVGMQLARMECLLREFRRNGSGGKVGWGRLFAFGNAFPTVLSAVRQGYLTRDGYVFTITDSGAEYLDQLHEARIAGISE